MRALFFKSHVTDDSRTDTNLIYSMSAAQTKAQKAAAKILAKKAAAAAAEDVGAPVKGKKAAAAAAAAGAEEEEEKKMVESDRHVTGVLASRPASKDVKIASFCMSAFGSSSRF